MEVDGPSLVDVDDGWDDDDGLLEEISVHSDKNDYKSDDREALVFSNVTNDSNNHKSPQSAVADVAEPIVPEKPRSFWGNLSNNINTNIQASQQQPIPDNLESDGGQQQFILGSLFQKIAATAAPMIPDNEDDEHNEWNEDDEGDYLDDGDDDEDEGQDEEPSSELQKMYEEEMLQKMGVQQELDALKAKLSEQSANSDNERRLNEKVDRLESILKTKTEECLQLKSRLERQEQTNTQTNANVTTLQQEMADLQKKLLESQRLVTKTQQQSEKTREEMQRNLDAAQREVTTLRAKSAAESFSTNGKIAEVSLVSELQSKHDEELNQAYERLDERTKTIEELHQSLEALETKNAEQSLALALSKQETCRIAIQLVDVTKERDTLEEEVSQCHDAILALQSTFDSIESKRMNGDLKRKVEAATLHSRIDEISAQLAQKDKAVKESLDSLHAVKSEKEDLATQLETAKASLLTVQKDSSEANQILQTELESLRIHLKSKDDEIANILREKDAAIDEKKKLSGQVEQSKSACSDLQATLDAVNVRAEANEQKISQQSHEIQMLKEKLANAVSNESNENATTQASGETTEAEVPATSTASTTIEQAELESLRATLAEKDSAIAQLTQQLDSLKDEKISEDSNEASVSVMDKPSDSLDDAKALLEAKVEELQSSLLKKETDMTELRAKIENISKDKKLVVDKLEELHIACQMFKNKADASTAAATEEKEKTAKSLEEAEELKQKLDQLKAENERHISLLKEERDDDIRKLTDELQSVKSALVLKTNEVSDLSHKYEFASKEKEELSTKLKEEENARQSAETAAEAAKMTLSEGDQESLNLKQEIDVLRIEIATISAKYEKAEAERLKTVKHLGDLGNLLKRTEGKSNEYASTNQELEKRVTSLNEEKTAALKELDEFRSRYNDLQAQFSKTLDELDKRKSNENILDAAKLRSECDKLRQQISCFKEKEDEYRKSIEDLEQKTIEQSKAHDGAYAKLMEENEHLKEKLQDFQALADINNSNQSQLQNLKDENEQLKAENEELYVHFAMLKERCDTSEQYIADLEAELERIQESGIDDGDEAATFQMERLHEENDHLQQQIDDLLGQNSELSSLLQNVIDEKNSLESSIQTQSIRDETGGPGTEYSRIKELEQLCLKQKGEISDLQRRIESFNISTGNDNRTKVNEKRVEELEKVCQELQAELASTKSVLESETKKALAEKDSQIVTLKDTVECLENDLQNTNTMLSAKERELDSAMAEARSLREKQQKEREKVSRTIGTEKDLESLRSYIVTLAAALEQAETKRAEAAIRLQAERESNAESLRRMSEQVKRFYSTVTFGDS